MNRQVDPVPARPRANQRKITLKCVSPYVGLTPIVSLADHTVVFTHIPKTAGTTLDVIMQDIAVAYGLCWHRVRGTLYGGFHGRGKPDTLIEFGTLSNEELSRVHFLTGHLPFGVHQRIQRKCFYITILREPISRLLSQFRFGVQRGGWLADAAIEELFRDGLLIDNAQTRQLAGLQDRNATCTPATLETALANLQSHYGIVGVTERFEEMLKALIGLFSWPDIAFMDLQVNRVSRDAYAENKIAEAARRYNEFDAELYAYAVSRDAPWSDGLFAGTPKPTVKQDRVLVMSRILVHYSLSRPFEVAGKPSFEQICRLAAANGDSVQFV